MDNLSIEAKILHAAIDGEMEEMHKLLSNCTHKETMALWQAVEDVAGGCKHRLTRPDLKL